MAVTCDLGADLACFKKNYGKLFATCTNTFTSFLRDAAPGRDILTCLCQTDTFWGYAIHNVSKADHGSTIISPNAITVFIVCILSYVYEVLC